MTPELLDDLERLEKAATPKEWVERVHWREYQSASDVGPAMESVVSAGPIYLVESHLKPWEWPEKVRADSRLIVALRNAAPDLLQSLRSLMAENEALKQQSLHWQEVAVKLKKERDEFLEDYKDHDEYLHNCNARLKQAGHHVLQGTMDGINSLANERDDLKEERDSLQAQLKVAVGLIQLLAKQRTPEEFEEEENDEWDHVAASEAYEIMVIKARETLAKLGAAQKEGGK